MDLLSKNVSGGNRLKKQYLFYLILFIVGIIPIFDLFHPGFPLTHDGDVHLLRLTNFYQSLQEGNIIPRWAANVNFGYGQPVFEFFYPLPSYLGSFLHLLKFSFADSLKIILISSITLSGMSMYLWLSQLVKKPSALIGGLLYIYAPFRFVDIYVRGDIGESLAFVFVPLVLYFICKIAKKSSANYVFLGGITFALLILTHNVVSLMFLPFFLFYGIFSCWQNSKKTAIYMILMFVLGFGLSAFFWIPGLFEAKYTLRNIVTAGEYKQRFVTFSQLIYGKWSYGGTGEFTVQLGILQWISFIFSFPLLYIVFKKNKKIFLFLLAVVAYFASGIFFTLPFSDFIWSKILLLQNFQFPWRFLIITIFGAAVIGSFLFDIFPKKYKLVSILSIILLMLFLNKDYWHADSYVQRPDVFFAGIQRAPADTGESSPIWSVRFMETKPEKPIEVISSKADIKSIKRTSVIHEYNVNAYDKVRLRENTLYFPGWNVYVDGKPVNVEFQDPKNRGLITFFIDKGKHNIKIQFKETKLRQVADLLSLAILIFVFFYFLFKIKRIWQKSQ